jgi:ribosomal protein L17
MEDEGMEMEMEEEKEIYTTEVNFDSLRDMIEKTTDEGKDQVVQAREANYISKGTYIWQLLS